MAKYRGRLEIIADILNVTVTGARKTHIMYVANLSYKLLQKYLRAAEKLGFICFANRCYQVTEKGRAFLEKYTEFSSKYTQVDGELQKLLFEREALEKLCEPSLRASSKDNGRRRRRK